MDPLENEGCPIITSINDYGKYPEFWDNDGRMDVLFNPFRERDLNPLGYDKKLSYWKGNVELFCMCNDRCCFTIAQLKTFFKRNGKPPYCLETVLDDMKKEKTILTISDFITSKCEDSLFNTLVKSPLSWCYKMVTNIGANVPEISSIDENCNFIHMPSLEKRANKFLKSIQKENKEGRLFTYQELSTQTDMNIACVKWIVHLLELRHKAHLITHIGVKNKKTLVKISSDNEPVKSVTEKELSLYVLNERIHCIVQELEELEVKKETAYSEVKMYLKKGMRQLAKSSLRKEKEIEKQISKKINLLDNLRSFEVQLYDTDEHKQILGAYQMAADVLKKSTTEKGLNLENVDNTMDEVVQLLENQSDIQNTLGMKIVVEEGDGDLETELANLLMDEAPSIPPNSPSRYDSTGKMDSNDLPDVPRVDIGVSKSSSKNKNLVR